MVRKFGRQLYGFFKLMEVRANFTLKRLLIWQRENPGKDNGVFSVANLVSNRSLNPFSTKISEKSQFLNNLWQTERFKHPLPTMCRNWVLNQGLKPQLRFATWACNYCLAIWWETCGLEIRFARGGNGVSNYIASRYSHI